MFKAAFRVFLALIYLTSFSWAQSAAVIAGFNGGVDPPDPYTLSEYYPAGGDTTVTLNAGLSFMTGKTTTDCTINPAQRTLVLVGFGQSNNAAVNPSAYSPSNPTALDNFNIYTGGCVRAADPLYGSSTSNLGPGTPMLRLADTFVTNNVADRVILAQGAIGATTSAMWSVDQFKRVSVTFARLKVAKITATAVLYVQGETDTSNGTTQAQYTSNFTAFVSLCRAAGYNGPIFIAQDTWNGTTTSAAIEAAQQAVVTNTANGIWTLGNMDQNTTTWRQPAGQPHLNDTGAAAWAAIMYTNMHAYGSPF